MCPSAAPSPQEHHTRLALPSSESIPKLRDLEDAGGVFPYLSSQMEVVGLRGDLGWSDRGGVGGSHRGFGPQSPLAGPALCQVLICSCRCFWQRTPTSLTVAWLRVIVTLSDQFIDSVG